MKELENNNLVDNNKNDISILNTDRKQQPEEKMESIPSEHNLKSDKRDVKYGKPIDN